MQRFAVIGLGRFGYYLAVALTERGEEVIAIDVDLEEVNRVRDRVAVAVRMDSTDGDALRAHGVQEVHAAIVTIGEAFESAVLTVAALKDLGVRHVVARAMTEVQSRILLRVGADAIASAEYESALRWASRLALPNLEQFIELDAAHSIIYLPAPSAFRNRTIAEIRLRQEFEVNLVAIRRRVRARTSEKAAGEADEAGQVTQVISVPKPSTKILEGDILILIGSDDHLARLPH